MKVVGAEGIEIPEKQKEDRVDVRVADALQTLNRLDGEFDLIFIDIEKKDYIKALPDCHRLLRKAGCW